MWNQCRFLAATADITTLDGHVSNLECGSMQLLVSYRSQPWELVGMLCVDWSELQLSPTAQESGQVRTVYDVVCICLDSCFEAAAVQWQQAHW